MAKPPNSIDCDVIVVGGGPAGLAAATWAGRYRRRVLLLDKGETRNRWVEASHGYLGLDGVRPSELVGRARADLQNYPEVTVLECEVFAARRVGEGFVLELGDGSTVAGRRVVIATGVRDVFPEVDGFFDHYGADVFHCPTCDGYEGRDADIVVFGWNEHVVGFSLGLLDWARSVTIVTDGRTFEGDAAHRELLEHHGIGLIEDEAVGFVGSRGDLRAVRLAGAGEVPCQLAFFSIAHQPAAGLALQLGCETTDEGCVIVNDCCETSVPGVYAAGDLTPGIQLIQVAAAKGAVAGVSAAQSLRGEMGSRSSPTPAPDAEEELAVATRDTAHTESAA
jgi:thioredoxin reductase